MVNEMHVVKIEILSKKKIIFFPVHSLGKNKLEWYCKASP